MVSALFLTCSFFLGIAGAAFIAKRGASLGLMDIPNVRSSHFKAVPKGGGIGILAAFLINAPLAGLPWAIWLAAAILSLISLIGDRKHLSVQVRLVVQFASSVLAFTGLATDSGPIEVAAGVFVIMATANFYNFIDGINGIAGIMGAVAFFLLSQAAPGTPQSSVALSMGAACLGFLPFNVPNARVFMGDVGSILIGSVFASLALSLAKGPLDFICLASLLLPVYGDELCTMVVRIRDGENLGEPHRRHIYQLLANQGKVAHWKIALAYGLGQLTVGSMALILRPWSVATMCWIFIAGLGFVLFAVKTRRRFEGVAKDGHKIAKSA